MAKPFILGRDINGYADYSLTVSDINAIVNMPATTEKSFTLPDYPTKWKVIFRYSPGASIIVNTVEAATAPSTTVVSGNNTLNPAAYFDLNGGTTISLITEDGNTPTVCISCYAQGI